MHDPTVILCQLDADSRKNHRFLYATPFRKSLKLHKIPLAAAPPPFSFRAPSFRFAPNRSRALANASFTNSLLPITAPSVK
jgi:hypothetical protein